MDPPWAHGEHSDVGVILDFPKRSFPMILYFFILWLTCADRASWVCGWACTAPELCKSPVGCCGLSEKLLQKGILAILALQSTSVFWQMALEPFEAGTQKGEGGCSMQNSQSPGQWLGDSTQTVFIFIYPTSSPFPSFAAVELQLREAACALCWCWASTIHTAKLAWVRKTSFGLLWFLKPSES